MPRSVAPARSRPPLAALATLALLAAAGCGDDKAARERFDRAQAACAAAVGTTLADAGAAIQLGAGWEGTCLASGSPFGVGDTCPGAPGPYTGPVCEVGYEGCAPGTSMCSSGPLGGCAYTCIVRVVAASPDEVTGLSTICAARFVSGQPFGSVTGRSCR